MRVHSNVVEHWSSTPFLQWSGAKPLRNKTGYTCLFKFSFPESLPSEIRMFTSGPKIQLFYIYARYSERDRKDPSKLQGHVSTEKVDYL